MIPGEYLLGDGDIVANAGRRTVELTVANTADRPIQVGSHFHFFEANRALRFDRPQAFGMRLNIPAGTAVRFEPGDEKRVTLVELAGARQMFGLNALTQGDNREQCDPHRSSEFDCNDFGNRDHCNGKEPQELGHVVHGVATEVATKVTGPNRANATFSRDHW